MNLHIKSTADIFSFNSRLVRLGLDDLSDKHAGHRMRGGDGSSIAFLIGHLLDARRGAIKTLGIDDSSGDAAEPESNGVATDDSGRSRVDRLAAQWSSVAQRLDTALGDVDEELLLSSHEGFPVADKTVRGALMFWAWHESYHVGQIGLIRTELGYPALRL